jgi:hypothetical protein
MGRQAGGPIVPQQVEIPVAAPVLVPVPVHVPAAAVAASATKEPPPSKQPVPKIYPRLPPPSSDGFEYFDTPTKQRPARPAEEPTYDWEDSDEELGYKKTINPIKRPRFGAHDPWKNSKSPRPHPHPSKNDTISVIHSQLLLNKLRLHRILPRIPVH